MTKNRNYYTLKYLECTCGVLPAMMWIRIGIDVNSYPRSALLCFGSEIVFFRIRRDQPKILLQIQPFSLP